MASLLLRRLCIFFVFTCTLFALTSPSSSENVTLSLYYEALCPYCADFIANHLVKLFDEGLISIVNLRMIPWGNAFIQPNGTFLCQHGSNECFMNTLDACTISSYPDVELHFRFIHCVERFFLENKLNEWISCFEMTGLGDAPVDCYTSGYGIVLEQKYAAETAQLNPPHRFVPWVVVNDQPLLEDFQNFVSYVCNAYKGAQVPEACKSLSLRNYSLQKENPMTSVCYADEFSDLTSAPAKSP